MEQKQVKLIGLKVQNNGIIQAAELTPDLLSKRLVLVTGSIGNGKSTLLNAAKVATSGTDAIKKTDALPDGFVAEALLLDGDTPIYAGVKTDTISRGEHAGDQKLVTYLYTKDANGKAIQPLVDGVSWTAAQYWKALTTELTYSLNDLFSENQTVMRKLIEKLFKPELDALHADELVKAIAELRKDRDAKRLMCQASGAYMERFTDQGWTENTLSMLKRIDIDTLRKDKTALEVERGNRIANPENEHRIKCLEIDKERAERLQKIKDEGAALREKENTVKAELGAAYEKAMQEFQSKKKEYDDITEQYRKLRSDLADFIGLPDGAAVRNEQGQIIVIKDGTPEQVAILTALGTFYEERIAQYADLKQPVMGEVPLALSAMIAAKIGEYKELSEAPVQYPEVASVDVSDIDALIAAKSTEIEAAELTNAMFDKYQMWQQWIAAEERYKGKLDELRRMYASINTGVEGMKIVPRDTDSGKVEVWVMYDGSYDPEYFGNPNKEMRYMFDYSSFQRTIIGLMLQAARLNLKPKALRLAFVDDVAFTTKDVAVLTDIAEKLDLRLITAWTHEADRDNLMDGQVLVEGGEIFFNNES